MNVAIVGSRGLNIEIPQECIPKETTLIVSGGAIGIDRKAREFAYKNGIEIMEILPEYKLYGKSAPLIRNDIIIEKSDLVVIFWDGKSRGTNYVMKKCKNLNKKHEVYLVSADGEIQKIPEQITFA